jgi:UDP-glucose 4-epimerase
MNVLVTGGAGFIGSHVVDRLVERGHGVAVLDNLSTGRRERVHPAASLHACDLRSEKLAPIIAQVCPDVVVHAAAQASVPRSIVEPLEDADVNVLGTVRLLQACMAARVRRFVYISTGGAAYGETDVIPTPEEHPLRPTSPYGVSKVSAEHYADCLGPVYGIRTVTLRLANVYGPRQDPTGEAGVVAIFVSRLIQGDGCVIYGDGEQTRDFVYVGDVADAVVGAIDSAEAVGAINVATGHETTIKALYERLSRITGRGRAARHEAARAGEQRRSALSPARAHRLMGWKPATLLDAGLARTVAYFSERIGART